MYLNNKPNQYNQPKKRERFSLKEGRYFWLSSIMKTFDKEKQKEYIKKMEQIEKEKEGQEEDPTLDDSLG